MNTKPLTKPKLTPLNFTQMATMPLPAPRKSPSGQPPRPTRLARPEIKLGLGNTLDQIDAQMARRARPSFADDRHNVKRQLGKLCA